MDVVGKASVATGEVASVLVTLKRNDRLPVTGREVILQVEPADNLRLIPTAVTDQEGKSSFQLTSSQPGVRMITASVGEVKLDASVAVIFSGNAVDTLPFMGITWEKDGSQMAYIPAGSFEMGDAKNVTESWTERSRPVHTVTLDGFYMDKTEVTVGQFKAFLADDSSYSWGGSWDSVVTYSPTDEHPMIYVNWEDAVAYAEWAGKRLPTEAEWEKAARGGLKGKEYPWGDEVTHDDANYSDTGGTDTWTYSAPVGSFEANGYGLYDMAGNVYEWCQVGMIRITTVAHLLPTR